MVILKCNHCGQLIHIDAITGPGPSRKCIRCRKKFDRHTWKSVLEEYKVKARKNYLYSKNQFIYGNRNSLIDILLFPITFPLFYISRLIFWSIKLFFKIIKYTLIILIILLIVNYFFDIDIFGKIREFIFTTFD